MDLPDHAWPAARYSYFQERIWAPLLAKAGLVRAVAQEPRGVRVRRAVIAPIGHMRWVQLQLGHASIEQTIGTYSHCQPERHEAVAAGLNRYLSV